MFPIKSTRPRVTEFQNPSCLWLPLQEVSRLVGWWATLPTAMSSQEGGEVGTTQEPPGALFF